MSIRFICTSILCINLISSFALPVNTQQNLLLNAINNNSGDGVQQVLMDVVKQGKDSKSPESILLKAIMTGTAEEIKQAVQPILNQGKNNMSPIMWAVLLKKPNAIEVLLECGVKVDASVVQYAAKREDLKTLLLIVKSGADIAAYMNEYMYLAFNNLGSVENKKIAAEMFNELIARGFDINKLWCFRAWNKYEVGIWHSVHKDILRDLLPRGINVNHVFENKSWPGSSWTPLVVAIINGDIEAVKFLLDAGAEINKKANPYVNHPQYIQGFNTPLCFAINADNMNGGEKKKDEIIALLLEHGAGLQ